MSSPLVRNKVLSVNPEAQQYHEVGLMAELSGSYTQAHDLFDNALLVLANGPQTLETVVQSARIERDDGFTYVRAAIGESKPSLLDRAESSVSFAAENVGWLVIGIESNGADAPLDISEAAGKEVLAEYGATVSLLGRIATVKEVMLGGDARSESEVSAHHSNEEQPHYYMAHNILRRGNNGYYRVSNAMVAARQERLNRRPPKVAMWLGRAVTGLAWTALKDPSNLRASVMTVANRARHLRNYHVAVKSVTAQP